MAETVAAVGEFGLIRRIDETLRREGVLAEGVSIGLGDDAASFVPRPGMELLVTCDAMVEGRHYLPGRIRPFDLGRRAMAVNVSDIGAMGGRPIYALVSLGLRSDMLVDDILVMYRGFTAELNPYGASVIGGNITKAESAFIDITLIGEAERGSTVRRSTARPGDAVLVTGHPGQSAAGLRLLLSSDDPDAIYDDVLVRAYTTPVPRAREGRAVARVGWATAMIDTSDGFLGDLGHVCEESGVGAELLLENLPVSAELREGAQSLGLDPRELFLGESDDYELIITCGPADVDRIKAAVASAGDVPVTEVGRITGQSGEIVLVASDGSRLKRSAKGWDHFTS